MNGGSLIRKQISPVWFVFGIYGLWPHDYTHFKCKFQRYNYIVALFDLALGLFFIIIFFFYKNAILVDWIIRNTFSDHQQDKRCTTLFAYPLDFMDFQFQVSLPRILRFKIARLLEPLVF